MAGSTTASWWQYSRWVWNIARNMRITNPTGAELTAVKTFIKVFWDAAAGTPKGTRPWLAGPMQQKSVRSTAGVRPDVDVEPAHVLVELVALIARDMRKIPVRDSVLVTGLGYVSEVDAVNELIWATETDLVTPPPVASRLSRRLGTGTKFGGVIGAAVGGIIPIQPSPSPSPSPRPVGPI